MIKTLIKCFFLAGFLLLLPAALAKAEDVRLNAYLFWGDGCPHCAKEKVLIQDLAKRYPEVRFYDFEVYYHPENITLMQRVAESLGADAGGIPFTVIGDQTFVGFSEDSSPAKLEGRIRECLGGACPDSVAQITGKPLPKRGGVETNTPAPPNGSGKKFTVPVLGEIDVKTVSLPLLAVVLGLLDGFNPCAMWTLLFLISLLLGMPDRKRMWILGSAFIAASAAVYFMFMAAWLNLILFLGFIIWVRMAIGVVAISGGGYSVFKFFTDKAAACEVVHGEKRQKVFQKIKAITLQKNFWVALGGIIILAFAVNLVELVCSAGLPAVFTQVLALSGLAAWQYYLYIVFYIFFFMLDDLIVFFVAMATLRITGLSTKYTRYSRLIGGVLMAIIGLILIFRPQLLLFG